MQKLSSEIIPINKIQAIRMQKIRRVFSYSKNLATQTALPQIVLYSGSKICFGLMELPHEQKDLTYIPFLFANIILLGLAIGLKIYRHKFALIRCLVRIQISCFLLWIISLIMMIFSWSLLDNFQWGLFEIILCMISEFLAVFMLTLITKQEFMSKMEFVSYQVILGLEIVAVSIKTVGFIRHNAQSPHKDIVLLNLTTQIALMIILMDFLQKSYSKWKKLQIQEDVLRFQNQMVVTNKITDSTRGNSNLRQTLQIRQ